MAVNKVDVNGVTVLDLTQDSVTPATLKKGETAHDASGAAIVGEMESSAPSLQSKSVTYTSNGTATIAPDDGYDGLSSVDVTVNVDAASVSTVTIHCYNNSSSAFWLSPDGVFHHTNLNAGANTIIVNTYSPIGFYNTIGLAMNNLNNIVNTGGSVMLGDSTTYQFYYYRIYYATATTASATQPTD